MLLLVYNDDYIIRWFVSLKIWPDYSVVVSKSTRVSLGTLMLPTAVKFTQQISNIYQ